MVKSIVNPLSISLATFATTGVSSFQLMPIFWTDIRYLENINLKVISATADGASPGKRCLQSTKYLRQGETFHLIKTSRNCIVNSGAGRATRFMWNNGLYILWRHISQVYYADLDCGLKLVNKLTIDHINLTPYSGMRVRLAAQTLSDTAGNVLNEFGPPDAVGDPNFTFPNFVYLIERFSV